MKRYRVMCAILSLALFAGCGVFWNAPKHSLAGIWTGTGVVGHGGVRRDWDVTLTFNGDGTFILIYEMDGKNGHELKGTYAADLSRRPAAIDITFQFPNNTSSCCLAIAEFPAAGKMNICGLIGECGKVSRPASFNRNPTNNHHLYHELSKKR